MRRTIHFYSMNFTHLLLTRFNIHFLRPKDPYPCDDEWHQERFMLFNRFCLPSVAEQTSQNFTWIIFFNEEKRKLYGDFIRETERKLPNIQFIFVYPGVSYKDLLTEYIYQNFSSGYLITTRFDNDDCISTHFVESVQKKFLELGDTAREEDLIINPSCGYQFELVFPFRKSVVNEYQFSPFLSHVTRIKNSSPVATVFDHSHHLWKDYVQPEELPNEPFWTQIIHSKNIGNRVLSLQLHPKLSDRKFPVFNKTSQNSAFTGMILLPLQYLITTVHRITRKIARTRKKITP